MNRNYSEERNVRSPGKESKRCAKDWNNRGIKMETTKWIRRNDKFKFSRDRESSYRRKRVFYSVRFYYKGTSRNEKLNSLFPRSSTKNEGGRKKRHDLYIYRNKTRYAYSFRDYLSRVLPRPEWQSSIERTSLDSFCGYSTYTRIAESLIQWRKA